MPNTSFSKIQLVGQNIETETLAIAKHDSVAVVFISEAGAFHY